MVRKSRVIAGVGALVVALLVSAGSASAGIVIVGETPPEVNLIIAGEEGGLFVQHGEVGDRVKIDGHGFTGATAVNFGSTAASFTVQALGYEIEAVAPPGEGTVPVTVTTPGGTSKPSFGDYFTYVSPPPPASTPAPPKSQPPSPAIVSAASASAASVAAAAATQPAAPARLRAHHARTKHRHRRKHHPRTHRRRKPRKRRSAR